MDENLVYYFTGFQLLNSGERIPFNTFVYNTIDEYKTKYSTEMSYALNAVDTVAGYVILIYSSDGVIVVQDVWRRGM